MWIFSSLVHFSDWLSRNRLWLNNFRFLDGLFWFWFRFIISFKVVINSDHYDLKYESGIGWNETITNVLITISELRWCNDSGLGSYCETNESFIPSSDNLSSACLETEWLSTEVTIENISVSESSLVECVNSISTIDYWSSTFFEDCDVNRWLSWLRNDNWFGSWFRRGDWSHWFWLTSWLNWFTSWLSWFTSWLSWFTSWLSWFTS